MAMAENEQAFIAQNRREPNSRKRKMRIGGMGGSMAMPPPPQAGRGGGYPDGRLLFRFRSSS